MRLNPVLKSSAKLLAAFALYPILTIAAPAQTYTKLHVFQYSTEGGLPFTPLVQGFDGQFYGTTSEGGPGGYGSFFKVGRYGKFTILHNFANSPVGDAQPAFNLLEDQSGGFYGTTGVLTTDSQELYNISETGTDEAILRFCTKPNCTDGSELNSLIWDWNHNLIASMQEGGGDGNGAIVSITPGGKETTIHTFFCFSTYCPYGANPEQLVQASDGNLYGLTWAGGTNGHIAGTLFTVGPSTPFTTLYDFCSHVNCADGGEPAQLIQGSDGNLYGTTEFGGAYNTGTIFKMTTAGIFTILYNFCGTPYCPDGAEPAGRLVEGSDGNFYGVNYAGGANGLGTIFRFTPSGEYTVLYEFENYDSDGNYPTSLIQGTDGFFYGTYYEGGDPPTYGGIFRLDVGLGPFVHSVLTFGKVGDVVNVLGTNLAGATAVSFNGTPAAIDLVTPYRIQATVPAGATSGTITVTLPTGTLSSNVAFTIIP